MTSSTATDLRARQAELLEQFGLLDGPPDAELDAVVRLASAVTGLPHAAVNLLDATTQHTVSAHGFAAGGSPREESLCSAALSPLPGVRSVGDLAAEPRFRDNAWVDGRRGRLRAYAGAPLVVEGTAIGTLCVFDDHPRAFTAAQLDRLADLAALVVGVFHRRQQVLELAVLAVESETARHQAEAAHAALERTEAFNRALLEAIPVGVVAADATGRLTTFNRLSREWHGLGDQPIGPTPISDSDIPAAFSLTAAGGQPLRVEELPLQRVFAGEEVRDQELGIARPGAPLRRLSASGRQVRDPHGRLLGAVVAMADVTAQRDLESALRSAALHDPLTGLPNRTLLLDRLDQALHAAGHGGTGTAVLYCDLDGFKAVNDVAGHAVGDEVLVEAARRLRAVVRPADTVARIGGDEFVVLCPGLGSAGVADRIAARIAEAFATPMASDGDAEHRVGVSIGITVCTGADTPETALAAADARMYEVKAARRSRGRLAAVPRR
ncbi:diguanylate cyclase domain-containing protein [Geodermatophilus sp. URMC 61]|uniref:diguanylate cyclase domain-containing protein n=1 Tax=Geodermatophilus sp. URMC 61 TaxID=3423411 RepID=UPI00406C6A6D